MLFNQKNRKNIEVYISDNSSFLLIKNDIDELLNIAKTTPRKRVRFCAHFSSNELVHEMFIVHPCGAYVRPHRHLNKIESMLVLKGKVDYVVFNGDGSIKKVIKIHSHRGTIYDRHQKPLALSIKAYSLYAMPPKIADKEAAMATQ